MAEKKAKYLTAKEIKAKRPTTRLQKISFSGYLYLFITPTGKKTFYFKGYRFNGKSVSEFAIGEFRFNKDERNGDLTLSEARDKVADIIRTYKAGIDYRQQQKEQKALAEFSQSNTFKHWANRWLETVPLEPQKTRQGYINRLNNYVKPLHE